MKVFLVFGGKEELIVTGYTGASFQTNNDDSRSQSGFLFCLIGEVVSLKSSKQDTVLDLMIETEYIAVSEVAMEAIWIRIFLDGCCP
jgi:hypothetical protein